MISDEDLAREVQKGHEAALEVLVHRHHRAVLGYLFRLTRRWQTAEDLAQEAFLRVLTGIRLYRHPRPFRPWLYAIATNVYRDYVKQAYVRRVALSADPTEAGLTDSMSPAGGMAAGMDDGPEKVLEVNETRRVLLRALGELTSIQREVVILHLYQDLTLAEVAEALGVPLGTVKSRLAAALVRLRGLLAGEGLSAMDRAERATGQEGG